MPDFLDVMDAYAALTGEGGLGELRRDTGPRRSGDEFEGRPVSRFRPPRTGEERREIAAGCNLSPG